MSSTNTSDTTKMSAAAKTTKKSVAAKTETPAAAAAPVAAAPAPAPAKATKKAAAPKAEAAPAVAAPVPAAVEATPAVAADEDIGATLLKHITELHDQLAAQKAAVSATAATLKTIEKLAGRVIKKADRRRKRKSADGAKSTSVCVFVKEVPVTDELASFLGKPKGTLFARSAVTKAVIDYAKSHNLMVSQQIKPDAALRKLLKVTEADNLSILNLQKYLAPHFVKAPVAAA